MSYLVMAQGEEIPMRACHFASYEGRTSGRQAAARTAEWAEEVGSIDGYLLRSLVVL